MAKKVKTAHVLSPPVEEVNKVIVAQFYFAVTEQIVTFSITVWYGNTSVRNKSMSESIVKTAPEITDCTLPVIQSVYTTRVLRNATAIISDSTHTAKTLFESLPSGKRTRSIKTRTTGFSVILFYPKAVETKAPNINSKE